ncbi:uncharacterized protein LOC117642369 [Thrips palmi]|uniref:DNA-directed DNA polymerase n=1 Tax=Thrips palmi TaxID=161013 RepID=A0A6P8YHB8_THRPL|nr:uncharacterized protein LOC117642369 [Thrips palmi]
MHSVSETEDKEQNEFTSEPLSSVAFSKDSSLGDKVVRYKFKIEGRAQADLNFALLDLLVHFQHVCEHLYKEWRGLKASLYCAVLLSKPNPALNQNEETIVAHLRSDTFVLLGVDSKTIDELIQAACMSLLSQLDSFSENGSGWYLEEVLQVHLNAASYNPLSGGCYLQREIPKWIKHTRSCIDIPRSGNQCFLYSVLACLLSCKYKNLAGKSLGFFQKYESLVDVSMIDFPVKINQISRFESKNQNLAVNVFGVEKKQKTFFPIRVSKKRGDNICWIDLLFLNNHYVAIVDKSRLFSATLSKNGHKRFFCDYCVNSFVSKRERKLHTELCQKQTPQKTFLPSDEFSKLQFSKIEYTEILDFFIVLDFEVILPQIGVLNSSTTSSSWTSFTQKHVPCTFAFCTVDCLGNLYTQPVVYNGLDAAVVLLKELQKEADKLLNLPAKPMLPFTPGDQKRFESAICCEKCSVPFDSSNPPNRDHNHFTGALRAILCAKCNLKLKCRRTITCLCHNLTSYDQFILLEAIAEIFNPSCDKLKIIPRTLEKYRSFTFNKLRFVDSFSFMSASLEKLVKTLGPLDFQIFEQHFTNKSLRDLLRNSKQKFPYEYCTSFERLKEKQLPSMASFYSSLTDETISLQEYNQCQKIFDSFECQNLQDYLNVYVKCDILLLACCIQNFRKVNFEWYGIDCLHFISAPSFYYQACLKMSGVVLDLFQDPNEYLMVENGIRGGLSQVFQRHCKANNPSLKNYDSTKPTSYAVLLDQNSLYAAAQYHFKMPVGNYRWLTQDEIKQLDVLNLNLDGEMGYIFYLDLIYPQSIKEFTKQFPLCPTTENICYNMLSDYQKQWLNDMGVRYPTKGVTKLVASQLDKNNLTIHLAPLQTYLKLGMKIGKIHRVLTYSQSYWLQNWVQFNIDKRKLAKTKLEQDTSKLSINSVFGSFLLCKRKQRRVTLVSNERQLRRLVSSPLFTNANVINNRLCVVEHRPSFVVLDRPYILGFCILEHAKTIVYRFYYDTLVKVFGERMNLAYVDTDSYFLTIKTDNLYEEFKKLSAHLDTSNYNPLHPLYSLENKGRLLCVKDELAGRPISEAIFIKSKCYCIQVDDDTCTKKLKGVSRRSVDKRLTFDDYLNCLYENRKIFVQQMQITNKDFKLYTAKSNRLAISSFDDKSYYLDSVTLQPHGYK